MISSSDYPSPNAQAVTVDARTHDVARRQCHLTIYRPANFDPHKKHPLLIGDTAINTSSYSEPFMTGMAACGACVAVVERPNWTPGLDQWAHECPGVYEKMKGTIPPWTPSGCICLPSAPKRIT